MITKRTTTLKVNKSENELTSRALLLLNMEGKIKVSPICYAGARLDDARDLWLAILWPAPRGECHLRAPQRPRGWLYHTVNKQLKKVRKEQKCKSKSVKPRVRLVPLAAALIERRST